MQNSNLPYENVLAACILNSHLPQLLRIKATSSLQKCNTDFWTLSLQGKMWRIWILSMRRRNNLNLIWNLKKQNLLHMNGRDWQVNMYPSRSAVRGMVHWNIRRASFFFAFHAAGLSPLSLSFLSASQFRIRRTLSESHLKKASEL